ncbi:hypothetical protein AM588_10002325 [Phytophthora nicotianae]|uniref:Uncharacterized protein n=1 Tax=Phytophthora nicotianae TaxID=4792 RepID=A0A0W8CRQ4_PHYNI|nr:hypothetical protein AM588_10002325 [Phytophthora nicotianae]
MDDWVDLKAFRKLWNKLIKSWWKARQPTVLEVDYTFVKPGVVGKLRKNQRNADNFIANDLDSFDRDDFLDVENLFGPVAADDINVAVESFAYGAESEDDEETFDEAGNDEEEYADEVESDPVFDDESGVFQQDDAAMRGLGESGWKIYDQDHCGKAVGYRITSCVCKHILYCKWYS